MAATEQGSYRRRVSARLQAIRAAARHAFPTADIEQMLAETERGYLLTLDGCFDALHGVKHPS